MQEELLIRLCQKGDIEAFRELYQRYSDFLFRVAVRMLGNVQESEDAVQITFLKLFKNIKKFRSDSKFSTYLYKIHFRVCLDLSKKMRKNNMYLIKENDNKVEHNYELKMVLEKEIEGLPSQQRACFILHAVEGFKQREISDILNISIGSVKSNLFHAKMKLRKKLSIFMEQGL